MADVNLALTTAGQALRAKIELGGGTLPLEITRIVTASGTDPDPLNLAAVVDERQAFTITDRVTAGARTSITAILTNYGNPEAGVPPLAAGYPLSQIGFYATDPDDGEILYRISQFDAPNWVPAANERGWTFEPTFNFITGNASEVIVQIDPSGFTTMQDIWNSVEYTDRDTPSPNVKTHYRVQASVPDYPPVQASPRFAEANITEVRVTEDPGDTANSPYKVALPITIFEAVLNKKTGQSLAELLELNDEGESALVETVKGIAAFHFGPGTLSETLYNRINYGFFHDDQAPALAKQALRFAWSGETLNLTPYSFAPLQQVLHGAALVFFPGFAAFGGGQDDEVVLQTQTGGM